MTNEFDSSIRISFSSSYQKKIDGIFRESFHVDLEFLFSFGVIAVVANGGW